jgi:DNA-binding IclR family transcriptional regulator
MNEGPPTVKTTERSFRLLEAIERRNGAGISELAHAEGLAKSAVYKHLRTLTRMGYLVHEDDTYYLSSQFLRLGQSARDRLPLATARDAVENLAETTDHVVNFVIHENDRGVFALCVEPDGVPEIDISQGEVAPLNATGGGKAILAFLPESERADILDNARLEAYTDKTITDPLELKRELQSIQDRRVAFDREEYMNGHQCVASPVIGADDRPVGAISVTGRTQHMSGKYLEEDVTGLVTSAAKSIENRLLSRG